ncbi:MAG: KpsF/GutQ family sugar-phosphate isomerase [Burkholderiaceae bacterium]
MTDGAERYRAFDAEKALLRAQSTFDLEVRAILGLKQRLTSSFAQAVTVMLGARGRVVVMGLGKSGHIGRKLAATLASTGTPALFVHSGEAMHGDLGMVQGNDVVLAISHSGESQELNTMLPIVKRLGVQVLAMTGRLDSTLARYADIVLDCGVEKEACPFNLVPTASSVAQLAMGDALAMALLDARGFRAEDFARSHPGGALGRRLLTHVHDVMRSGDAVPRIGPLAGLTEMMREMGHKGMGAVAIVDARQCVLGIFTDGDLRRLVENGSDLRSLTAGQAMHSNPYVISAHALAADAAGMMERHRITSLLVVEGDGILCGALNSNDLMRAKVI